MPNSPTDKLAVLIDAENAHSAIVSELLAEVARYGKATVKRAYGDWTTTQLAGWKEALHHSAIQPVQQFHYTSGKNATDSALIIDAMDLLHGGKVDGFCLVSSDSDFTRLATRVRESGLSVYGFGEKKTPKPFVAACDKFVFTETLRKTVNGAAPASAPAADPHQLKAWMVDAVNAANRNDGWASLSAVASLILKASPSFKPRNFGCKKFSDLARSQSWLEFKSVPAEDGTPQLQMFVRLKEG